MFDGELCGLLTATPSARRGPLITSHLLLGNNPHSLLYHVGCVLVLDIIIHVRFMLPLLRLA